ncbi:EAL domain-containing protein [Paraburkholderia sp. 22B1P]|uniref:sensor domain-containing protein n=1 Tax=Paraburkholderia sp. 22B1P TaxID=3080498 RepID=UPI003092F09B|nr:EAL domain-containing protein [Paraburkholderia sp. 22B1P]
MHLTNLPANRSALDLSLTAFIENIPDMVWIKDPAGVFLMCNAVVERFLGAKREEILGKTDYDFVNRNLADEFRSRDIAAMEAGSSQSNQEWLTFPDSDEPRLFETKKTPMRNSSGEVTGVLGIARDITGHHMARAAQASLSRALKLIGRCNHAMVHARDERALLLQICQLAVDVGGYRIACIGLADNNQEKTITVAACSRGGEVFLKSLPLTWSDSRSGVGIMGQAIRESLTIINRDYNTNPAVRHWREKAQAYGLRSSIAIPLTQDGAVFAALMIGSEERDAFAEQEQALLEEMAVDVAFGMHVLRARAERDAAQRQLEFLAHHDALTGTPNRVMLRSYFDAAVESAKNTHTSIAIVMLDLDNFKFVNESLGHDYGDRLLIEVTRKLERRVRDTGMICRYGGDEFVLLLRPVCERSLLEGYIRKLIDAFSVPVKIGDCSIDVTTSAGISLYPSHGEELDVLLRYADTALQRSKRSGKNMFHFFDETMRSDESQLGRLRTQLRTAVRNNELVLHFQPKVNLADGRVSGAEALVRWQHPEKGLLGPGAFVPLAERTGTIVTIGDWVIDQSCQMMAKWRDMGLAVETISVNVSALQVRRGNLYASVAAAVRRWKIPPASLELELTESIVLDDAPVATGLLKDLRSLGVKLSIDDFGTGYSSLSYLKNLPVDRLKVDQQFVRDMVDDQNTLAIVKTIVQLGYNLNLAVTAEGVENEQQLDILRQLGCEEAQGFLIGRPMVAESLEAFAREPLPHCPLFPSSEQLSDGVSI